MSVSLLKRYKNEIGLCVKRLKEGTKGSGFYKIITPVHVKLPYANDDFVGRDFSLSIDGLMLENIHAIESNGLVYIGSDITKKILSDIISYSIKQKPFCSEDSVVLYYMKQILFKEIDYITDVYLNSYDENVGKFDITGYSKDLVLEDEAWYIWEDIFDRKGSKLYCNLVYLSSLENKIDNTLTAMRKSGVLQKIKIYNKLKEIVEGLYDIEVSLSDKEYPKLNNRKFLPIAVIDFSKNTVSYYRDRRNMKTEDNVNFSASSRGLVRRKLEDFMVGKRLCYPPLHLLKFSLNGRVARLGGTLELWNK